MNIKETFKTLDQNKNNLYIIHYSCENLNDNNQNYSPRITSIAVLHIPSDTMHSFSIHLIAEKNGIARDCIHEHYDSLEAHMLGDFFKFVGDNNDAYWLHWNMTNINYGFEALAHRYEVLTGEGPRKISDSRRYNLSSMILSVYGKDCVEHPRMPSFMKLNDGEHRDILSGKEEVDAFSAKEYVKLHKSTMSKAYWFKSMYLRLRKKKINVHNSNFGHKVDAFLEKPLIKILGFVAVLIAIFQLVQFGWGLYR